MNQTEKYLVSYLKKVVFIVICLLVFFAAADLNTDRDSDSFRGNVLRSEVRQLYSQAILNPAVDCLTTIYTVETHTIKKRFSADYKPAIDSRLLNQRLITLRKDCESILPLCRLISFLRHLPENPDELPDLS